MFLPSDHRGHARRFLLDLEWGGQSYHLSTDDTSYIDDDGEETRYTGALELDEVPLDVGVRNADAPALTVPAVLHLDGIADVPLLIAQGHDLGAALCKLWVWLQDTSKRVLLLDGQVLDPLWGAAHEPVTLSLLDTRRENALRFPPLDARVSPDTWPTIYGGSVQQFYPWVIGKPGDNTTGAWGSPALVVETVLQVAVGNRHIDFDEGSGEVTASLTVASYSPSDLAAQIVTKMDAAGVDSYTATIEAGTGLWTIASATGGTFSLLWSTGTNSANTAGTLLGADTTTDTSTAASHTLARRANGTAKRILLAGHPVDEAAALLINAQDDSEESFTVSTVDDGAGRQVAVVDIDAGTVISKAVGGGYFARLNDEGGLLYRGALLEGAGDVLRWAYGLTDVPVNQGSLSAIAPTLNAYKLAGYVMAQPDRRVDMVEWLRSTVLPLLPVSVYDGPAGLEFVLWRWGARASDAVAQLVEGENAERAARIEYGPRDAVRNEYRLDYAIDASGRRPTRREIVTGDRLGEGSFSRVCAESLRSYGAKPYEASTPMVYDPATAARIVRNYVAELAPRHVLAQYVVPEYVGAHLRRGDVVEVTDSELHMVSRLFFVVSLPVDEGDFVRVGLRSIR